MMMMHALLDSKEPGHGMVLSASWTSMSSSKPLSAILSLLVKQEQPAAVCFKQPGALSLLGASSLLHHQLALWRSLHGAVLVQSGAAGCGVTMQQPAGG